MEISLNNFPTLYNPSDQSIKFEQADYLIMKETITTVLVLLSNPDYSC